MIFDSPRSIKYPDANLKCCALVFAVKKDIENHYIMNIVEIS